MPQKTLILIDGHALAFRSFFALERTGMKTTDNQPTWAVFGFFKAMFDLLKNQKIKPSAIAVAFDVGRETFRLEEYPEYKANRQTMPDTLRSQIQFIIEGLQAFNIPIYAKAGFEADDVIGTIATKAKELGHKTLILTGDQDAFQLIDRDEYIKVLIPSKGELIEYNWKMVHDKLGVYPCQVVDYKALRGDTSDNIPGIRGIGEKTAVKLLDKFETLENILEHYEEIPEKGIKAKIQEGVDIALLSKFLATIKKDVEIGFDFEKTHLNMPEVEKVAEFLKKAQFFNFLRNLNSILLPFGLELSNEGREDKTETKPSSQLVEQKQTQLGFDFMNIQKEEEKAQGANFSFDKITINTKEKFFDLIKELEKQSIFAIDTETTGLNTLEADLVGISIAFNPQISASKGHIKINNNEKNETKSYYIPVFHLFGEQLDLDFVLENLKPILENNEIFKTTQNGKYEINIFKKYQIDLNAVIFDTMLASYINDSSRRHGLKTQASEHLGYLMKEIEVLLGSGKNAITMEKVSIEEASDYACDDAYATLELTRFWEQKLSEKEKDILYNIETPLIYVLADMERSGVAVDTNYLNELSQEVNEKIFVLEEKIFELAEERFNINSPKQVGDLLFGKLGLKPKSKTKTKNGFSTNAKILEELEDENEIVKYLLEHRHLQKLKSTYIDTLPELINPVDNRVHTSFNQTITNTGRLSSSNPNLQNIPIRTEMGNRIRKAFVPGDKENYLILCADYSQIELRLLAHCSRDDELINAFCSDEDIHSQTAAKVFEVPLEAVEKDMRYKAKAVNFGIIYGQSRYGLAKSLNITPVTAQIFIDKYFATYPKIKEYMAQKIQEAHQNGYVETIYGRKRYLTNELNASNRQIRDFGERAAINAPLQGSAADLVKDAMIKVHNELVKQKLKSKLIIQVHDELVLEVYKSELEAVKKIVKEGMELNQPLLVPLKIDFQVGKSWMEVEDEEA